MRCLRERGRDWEREVSVSQAREAKGMDVAGADSLAPATRPPLKLPTRAARTAFYTTGSMAATAWKRDEEYFLCAAFCAAVDALACSDARRSTVGARSASV